MKWKEIWQSVYIFQSDQTMKWIVIKILIKSLDLTKYTKLEYFFP